MNVYACGRYWHVGHRPWWRGIQIASDGGFGHFEGRPDGHPHVASSGAPREQQRAADDRRDTDYRRWARETGDWMRANGWPFSDGTPDAARRSTPTPTTHNSKER